MHLAMCERISDVPVCSVAVNAGSNVSRVPCGRIEDGACRGGYTRWRKRIPGGFLFFCLPAQLQLLERAMNRTFQFQ